MDRKWHGRGRVVALLAGGAATVLVAALYRGTLAASANATLLVVEQGRTTFPALRHAKGMLDRVSANTIGAVVNKVRASSGSYYYGYGNYGQSPNGHATEERPAKESELEGRAAES